MNKNKTNSQPLEKTLWQTAEKLRKNIDAAEYKHVVLGLIFLKYISAAFDKLYLTLQAAKEEVADLEGLMSIRQKMCFLCRNKATGFGSYPGIRDKSYKM